MKLAANSHMKGFVSLRQLSSTLDEVHCLWPLCSHTCCWEAERRIRTGKPHMLKAFTSRRASAAAADDDSFPAVTVVNAADWTNAELSTEVLSLKSEDNVSESAANALISRLALPRGAKRQKKIQIPISSPAMSAHLETHRETIKLRSIQMSPLPSMSQSSKAVMTWVPNTCYFTSHDSQLSVKSPQLAIKNQIFLPSAEMNKSIVIKKKLKQDKARKRFPLKRTSLKSQLNQERRSSLKSEVDTDPSDPGWSCPGPHSNLQCHRPVGQTLAAAPEAKDDQQPPSSVRTPCPRNRPVVLQPFCERIQRRHTRDEHRTSKHKLDMKTGMDGIDWESLERQTYLWRRQTLASSLEDEADHVPDSLHPASIPSSYNRCKSLSATGAAKCLNKDYMNGIWQRCSQFLPSKYKGRLLRNDDFRFLFSTYFHWNPAQHSTNADDQSDMELCIKGASPPPNCKQSSLVSSTVEHATSEMFDNHQTTADNSLAASHLLPPSSLISMKKAALCSGATFPLPANRTLSVSRLHHQLPH
ncbi:hypothetical protein PAMP_022728 [Pampus punctatissimus]